MSSPTHGYWRSLAELAGTDDFRDCLQHEFPERADQWPGSASRRSFLKMMGASLALAGLEGCSRQPDEQIIPYVRQPDGVVPGKPLHFATTLPIAGDLQGVLVKSEMGRPIKVEGNPQHPASLGATSAAAQASILSLYDPNRSQAVRGGGVIGTWDEFLTALRQRLGELDPQAATGLRVLTEDVASPTLTAQLGRLLEQFPGAQWHRYEPVGRTGELSGTELAFGEPLQPVYHFDRADVVLLLDADPLGTGAGQVRYARDFSRHRRVRPGQEESLQMSRVYAVESTPTISGAAADHRLPLRPDQIEDFVRALASSLDVEDPGTGLSIPSAVADDWWEALIDDLQNYRPGGDESAALVVPALWSSPEVHRLACLINSALGNIGKSVTYIPPTVSKQDLPAHSLGELVEDMNAEKVDVLLIFGGNPVYSSPADFEFASALDKVPLRVHHSLYEDETSQRCHWHLPASHPLESWSDGRAFDGTASIIQPLIAPLYDGRSAHELIAAILQSPEQSAHELVQAHWRQAWQSESDSAFQNQWQTALHDGIISGSAPAPVDVSPIDRTADTVSPASRTAEGPLRLLLRPDPSVWDGSLANNAWLQELPKPFSKLTWDNAALLSAATADQLGLADEDLVEIRAGQRTVTAPVLILPGQADQCVTLHLGYGRTRGGEVASQLGFNANNLRFSDSPWVTNEITLERTGRRYPLARTQDHHLMDGRDLVRAGSLSALSQSPEHPEFMPSGHHDQAVSLYPEFEYEGHKWGMSVDLTSCIGCNACVLACQAENNIPVVGKDQVRMGREMHWLRIDHYYHGEPANPSSYHQPVMCMHCEQAPCEVVCPVAATVHTDEGLNAMVYNRCVGTRYCSNNCPYKVRRFNFLQYSERDVPVLELLHNPEVTVRNRGVMEKCTYCVQRISHARIDAERAQRPLEPGEVVTACQSACPTQAIVFGDLNNDRSDVAELHHSPLSYALLEELGTKPRTTYLAAVRNPHPAIE